MGSSCVTGKAKNYKSKSDSAPNKQKNIENPEELKKQANLISFQHKFPTIRPLLNNDLYKSRLSQNRKNTLEYIDQSQSAQIQKKISSQKTASLSQVSMNFQATRVVI
ncbi:hypothetical protein ABPG72_007123 [Tetrahymena utriculariae]